MKLYLIKNTHLNEIYIIAKDIEEAIKKYKNECGESIIIIKFISGMVITNEEKQ